ncbi:MAG: GNAT family N-acetyltransferase [Clostridiales bacterium]|jgi:aminoglycoside 6'-N-acetyltransferase I|nr:GNAT family N-acetyltransferase [Clostridiales bacterium]
MELIRFSPEYNEICASSLRRVFSSEPFCIPSLEASVISSYISDLEKRPNSLNFALLDEGAFTGAVFGDIERLFVKPFYCVNELFIDPDHQGKGMGAYILKMLETVLSKEYGVQFISLLTRKDIPAFDFYEHNGFRCSDATVHMTKILQPV